MKVLISGAGIAGPCLAYWLERHGFEVTIVEHAPHLRRGGYIIDFWGAGFDVAERMGLLPQIRQKGYQVKELRLVDREGRRVSGFPVSAFDRVTQGRFTSVARSELAAAIHGALDGRVETIFGDTITALEERGGSVQVRFERAGARRFDLVIGADGLRSQVRRLVFGEDGLFERFLGMKVAALEVHGYHPRDELTYVIHSEIGQQIGRFAMRDDRTLFLFTFADQDSQLPFDLSAQKALVRTRFSNSGWECPRILEALAAADTLYVDRVSQIHMERWSRGRVALVGDAAFCVSLLAGQGSALAMAAAYILAGELKWAKGDHELAFSRYQERLGPLIVAKQKAAVQLKSFFAPPSRLGMALRNQVMKLMAIPFVSELTIGRELRDRIELPAY